MLTGGRYFSSRGESFRRFYGQDSQGLALLQAAGIVPAVIGARVSRTLRTGLKALGVTHAWCGIQDKGAAAQTMLDTLGLRWDQAAVMGGDWPDLPMMRRCAFRGAPADAHVEVRAVTDHITRKPAGQGAAREFCDLLLVASGKYAGLLEKAGA